MTPLRDPVKNIVYNASDEDVDRVYVNGRLVVDGGRVLGADEGAILGALQAGGERMWPRMTKYDWAGAGRRPALAPDVSRVGVTLGAASAAPPARS